MEPKVLADALVEAGIVTSEQRTKLGWDVDDILIEDWRVAGKVLESMESYDGFTLDQSGDDAGCNLIRIFGRNGVTLGTGTGDFPTAIIEAWYESR